MAGIGESLARLEGQAGRFSVEALCGQLNVLWIEEVLREKGKASRRRRKLPSELVVWLVIAMGLYRRLSIPNTLSRLGEGFRGKLRTRHHRPPTSPALTQGRDRLGPEVMQGIFTRFAGWLETNFAAEHLWKGLTLVAIDGTTAKTPDSKANREHFGAPGSHRGRSGYPFVRMVTLLAAHTHLMLAAAIGGWNVGEQTLALRLLDAIKSGWLLLLDRGFLNYWLLWNIRQRQSHFLIRGRRRLKIKKRKKLGPGDWLADALIPREARSKHPQLPELWRLRIVHYRIPGFRPAYLITSLLDAKAYPAAELIGLYHQRWELELAYDEMKTHMASTPVTFRSQTPSRVLQEAYGLLIAYNLVRGLMAQAAKQAGISPVQLGFVDSLERIERAMLIMARAPTEHLPSLYRELLEAISRCQLPPRRHRRFPRAVKVKMSSFKLKRSRHAR